MPILKDKKWRKSLNPCEMNVTVAMEDTEVFLPTFCFVIREKDFFTFFYFIFRAVL